MSRVQVLDYPVAHPGKCALCGGNSRRDGRRYVDVGISVKVYGAIIFCSICLAEIMSALDWIDPDHARNLRHNLEVVSNRLERVEAENVKLRAALAQLDFLGSNLPSYHVGMDSQDSGDSELETTGNQPINTSQRRERKEQGSSQSSDVGGSQVIRDPELSELLGGTI